MSLARKNIRTHLQNMLIAAVPEVNGRVFPSRAAPIDDKNLPSILIYTRSESAELFSDAPKQYLKKARTQIEIVAKGDETVDDTLDEIAEKVFKAIVANPKLGVIAGGTAATGNVTISGNASTVVPVNTILIRADDGAEYKTITAATLSGSPATDTVGVVQTTLTSRIGNCDAGNILTLKTPIVGVSGVVVANGGLSGGVAGEVMEAAADSVYTESSMDISAEGSTHIGACGVTFEIEYYEDGPGDLSANYPPLVTAQAGWDLAPPDGTLEAEDTIKFEQP